MENKEVGGKTAKLEKREEICVEIIKARKMIAQSSDF